MLFSKATNLQWKKYRPISAQIVRFAMTVAVYLSLKIYMYSTQREILVNIMCTGLTSFTKY